MAREIGNQCPLEKKAPGNSSINRGEIGGWLIEAFHSNRELDDAIDIFLSLLDKRRASGAKLKDMMEMFERRIVVRVLFEFNGSQVRAAEFLNLKASTLHEKMRKYGILMKGRNSISLRTFIPVGYQAERDDPVKPPFRQSLAQNKTGKTQRLTIPSPARKAS